MKRLIIYLCFIIVLIIGCKAQNIKDLKKEKDLKFKIVEEDEVPKELCMMIESQKKKPFRFSYADGKDLYIVIGYGEQSTGGYSIKIKELYLTKQEIVIETELLGPSKDEVVTRVFTYPYVIVKTKYIDKPVYYK